MLTPGKSILAVPSKETPPIFLAVAKAVAVSALPVTSPVTFPVNAPSNVPATKVSEPIVHLSVDSFQIKVLFVESPRSISIPAFSVGVDGALLFNTIMLSSTVRVSVFIVVVVPLTVKLPATVISLKVTLSEVPTD